jgi:hypothetical protein
MPGKSLNSMVRASMTARGIGNSRPLQLLASAKSRFAWAFSVSSAVILRHLLEQCRHLFAGLQNKGSGPAGFGAARLPEARGGLPEVMGL